MNASAGPEQAPDRPAPAVVGHPESPPARRRLPPGARRAAVLDLLTLHPDGLSVAEVARELAVHQNTVRTHLDALVRSGQATRRTSPSGRPGRPSERYTATGAPVSDRNYRLLAEMLVGRLTELSDDPASEAIEAGRRWSAGRGPDDGAVAQPAERSFADEVRPVLTVLTSAGFAPELDEGERRIELHHCPFLELAVSAPEVVCGAHLGLIRGTLERSGASVDASRIVPFARPGVCLTELT